MSKLPYIPIMIGDWEQDTNTISLEAEGALLKLTFKLWKGKQKGIIQLSLLQSSLLFKKSEEISMKIIKELQANQVLDIEIIEGNLINFKSRRMLKAAAISEVRSESGALGANQTNGKTSANSRQNAEYEIEDEIESAIGTIIDNLNLVTNSSFRKNSDKNKKHISARLREGFKTEEFFAVIKHKFLEWGNDAKMVAYLRPETLFGTKFESYLESSKKIIIPTHGTNQQNRKSVELTFTPGGAGKL